MSEQTQPSTEGAPESRRNRIASALSALGRVAQAGQAGVRSLYAGRGKLLLLLAVGGGAYWLYQAEPLQKIGRGEVAVKVNQFSGQAQLVNEGLTFALPGIHSLRRYPLQDQIYRPQLAGQASNSFQSVEGLSLGVDLTLRYALDPAKLAAMRNNTPKDLAQIQKELLEPAVQGVIYKAFTRYTVREIFSAKRADIQQQIEAELKPLLAADGIVLRAVMMGRVDLPADYKRGMENLLAEELATEKMRYTLEMKEKLVKQTELESEAEKVKREKNAEAAARETVIAARAQEEAMKHVLPFKQKQIEQRGYEAEAEKAARIKTSEGAAQARIIEAQGEADSRRKLADAEVYRQDLVGKVASAQLERDGALISKHPLLIQKSMADKLSDKIQVIIAPPPANGGFIGDTLLGKIPKGRVQNANLVAEDSGVNSAVGNETEAASAKEGE